MGVLVVERLAEVVRRNHAVPTPQSVTRLIPFVEAGRGIEQPAQNRAVHETIVGLEDSCYLGSDLFSTRCAQPFPGRADSFVVILKGVTQAQVVGGFSKR